MAAIKTGDTWPPLRGRAEDENGALPLADAESVTFLAKSGATLITGAATVINPPDGDGFNWQYTWGATDTSIVGDYSVELEILWDSATTPDQIETVPNGDNPTLEIVQDLN